MERKVNETTEQWDDVPAKVVGRRRRGATGWRQATVLQDNANAAMVGRTSWPKGVFRFRTFDEADAWWIQNIQFRTD
jgi:hypothetical protein